jgi:TIR domain
MNKKVFISYCHKQSDWVLNRLVPCLKAGGAEVFIDLERFKAGLGVKGQMDATQDTAEMTVLILTPDYLESEYCRHEMMRAIARDPMFTGAVIPVKRHECEMPDEIKLAEPLWINLIDDLQSAQWKLLFDACGADLRAEAPHWLNVRDEIRGDLARGKSVNLVVVGNPQWRQLVQHLRADYLPNLGIIDLDDGVATTRTGLVAEVLRACGIVKSVPPPPEDLVTLGRELTTNSRVSLPALEHFDRIVQEEYGTRLLPALRNLVTEKRKLVLLAQSRKPFAKLLPDDDLFASTDIFTMVELRGRER